MKLILGITLILALWSVSPLASSNHYQATNDYGTINVKHGDNVWIIAEQFVTEKEDIRNLVIAIREVNNLGSNAHIYPGQQLRVPISK